jgi:hypothetical protein
MAHLQTPAIVGRGTVVACGAVVYMYLNNWKKNLGYMSFETFFRTDHL